MRLCSLLVCSLMLGLLSAGSVQAQGLLWSLPDDGTWVRYEGTYSQLVRRPDSTQGDLTLEWIRYLTIKSVGTSEENYNGQVQSCRWIEIKVETGQIKDALIDPGPGGRRIYKLLVPEAAITGEILDSQGILVSYIPVVRGYRKLGDEDPQPIESGVFQIYPVISFLKHYRDLAAESTDAEQLQITAGFVNAVSWKGQLTMESRTTRSTNEAQMWRSDDVPFGLAKWIVRDMREAKHPTQSRDQFQETTEVTVEMAAHEIGTAAETELVVD